MHNNRERVVYEPYEKEVHIHKAPTDESIRLYKEMEQKARDAVIKVDHIDAAGVHVVAFYTSVNNPSFIREVSLTIIFKINNTDYKITILPNQFRTSILDVSADSIDHQVAQVIYNEVLKALAEHITVGVLKLKNKDQ